VTAKRIQNLYVDQAIIMIIYGKHNFTKTYTTTLF